MAVAWKTKQAMRHLIGKCSLLHGSGGLVSVGAHISEEVKVIYSQTYRVMASEDDTRCTSTENQVDYRIVNWRDEPYTYRLRGFCRWKIYIPKGSRILEAFVSFHGWISGVHGIGPYFETSINLLDEDSAADFSTNPIDRPVTATVINWPRPDQVWGCTWYDTVDIKDLVQEFINRLEYCPGNYIGLRFTSPHYDAYEFDQYDSITWGAKGEYAPKLILKFEA